MLETPALETGDEVACGQPLGAVGGSGNALNPHLHLETRLGPGGALIGSLAHYDSSASLLEMNRYCTWRVSGLFQILDPRRLLGNSFFEWGCPKRTDRPFAIWRKCDSIGG
ncbi:MAG: hypothetical protein EHM70_23795 [Chloroflexota bacterium]|nr:MAG: hypothetical protein EHM70_23795 [Chloroflexota bacterium]